MLVVVIVGFRLNMLRNEETIEVGTTPQSDSQYHSNGKKIAYWQKRSLGPAVKQRRNIMSEKNVKL